MITAAILAISGMAVAITTATPGVANADGNTIPVQSAPVAVAVDPSTNTVYVANYSSHTVSVINGATCDGSHESGCTILASATMPGDPDSIAIDESTHTIYVGNYVTDSVSVIDGATCNASTQSNCNPVGTITVSAFPAAVSVNPTTDTIYVTGGSLSVINGATCNGNTQSNCTPLTTASVGVLPNGSAVDATTNTIYIANQGSGSGNSTVSVVDGATCDAASQSNCSPVGTVTVGSQPTYVGVNAITNTAYATNQQSGTVSVIGGASCDATNQSSCNAVATVTVGSRPGAVVVDPTTDTVYEANEGSGTVSVLNGATCDGATQTGCSPESTVTVGTDPLGLDLFPSTSTSPDTVYVTNLGDNSVSVFGQPTAPTPATAYTTTVGAAVAWTAPSSAGLLALQSYSIEPSIVCTTCTGLSATAGATSSVVGGLSSGSTYTFGVIALNAAGPSPPAFGPPITPPASAPVQSYSYGTAVNSVTDTIYVVNLSSNSISVLNGASCNAVTQSGCAPVATVPLGRNPYAVAVNDATNTVYVADYNTKAVSVINGASCDAASQSSCAPVTTFSVNAANGTVGPDALAVDDLTNTLYVGNYTSENLDVINGATCDGSTQTNCTAVADPSLGGFPQGIAVNENTDTVYISNNASDTLEVINGATCNATSVTNCAGLGSPSAGSTTQAIAVDDATNTIYYGENDNNDIGVINGAVCDASVQTGCSPVANVVVSSGSEGDAVAVDPGSGTVYALSTNSMSVIDGAVCDGTNQSGCTSSPGPVVGKSNYLGSNQVALLPSTSNAPDVVYSANQAVDTVSIFGEPTSPQNVSAALGSTGTSATVSWSAPASNGELPISKFTIGVSPACPSCSGVSASPSATSTTVSGLTSGTAYTFSVRAVNAAGPSPPASSNSVASLTVSVSGTQRFGSSAATLNYTVTPASSGVAGTLTCGAVDNGTPIDLSLSAGSYTVEGSSCSGLTAPSGDQLSYAGATDGFVVSPAPITVTVTGTQSQGSSSPQFLFSSTDQQNVIESQSGLICHDVFVAGTSTPISASLAVGSYDIDTTMCSGLSAASTNYSLQYSPTGNIFAVGAVAPTVSANPTGVTAAAGGSAEFSAATSASPSPTVAWEVSTDDGGSWSDVADGTLPDGSTISGSTATTLTLSSLAPDENGEEFRAVFTNTAGSATTSPATLQVQTSFTLLVAANGSDTGNCEQNACQTIQYAVNQAEAFDAADSITIDVAASTYPESVMIDSSLASLVIAGAGSPTTTVEGQSGSDFTIDAGTVTLSGLTITGGTATLGGGVYNSGTVTLVDDTVSGDTASGGFGGGFYNHGYGSVASISDSTFSGDVAQGQYPQGGGFFNDGGYATLTNDTFTNDLAYLGGAVSSGTAGFAAGTTIVTGDTFTGDSGTAIFYQYSNIGGHVTISDSLLASNPQGNCYAANAIPGTNLIYDGGGNVVDDTSCLGTLAPSATPSTVATDFQIWGPSATPPALAANGSTGPETVAIIPESAAAGAVSAASCLAADERGDARPGFTAPNCDAGAFELQGPALFVTVSGSQTYGSSTPTFTYGEAPANVSLTGTVTCSSVGGGTAIGSGLAAGSYTIDGASCSGLTAQGYTVDYLAAGEGFDVSPAPLVITASSATMTYGQTPPDIAASYYGFVNGEGMSALTSQPTCSTSASASSGVGTYSTSCTGAAASNYAVINLPGTLTIDPQVISVTVTGSQEYGSSTPSFSFTAYPSQPSLTGTVACNNVLVAGTSTPISASLAVGSYDIDTTMCSGLSAASTNYSLQYSPTGNIFAVGAVAPTVSANPTGVTAAAGGSAEFSAATSASPSPTVAWEVSTDDGGSWSDVADGTLPDGSTISGSTATTLTLSSLAPDENGEEFRAVFTNTAGSATTSPATLQVQTSFTLLVAANGSDTGNCEQNACQTIQYAVNQAEAFDAADSITIDVAASTYPESVMIDSSLASLVIAGAGSPTTTVEGQSGSDFTIDAGTVTLSGLTITGGTATLGGGVYNSGTVTLVDDTVSGDTASGGFGGGFYNHGYGSVASISDSTFSGDVAQGQYPQGGGFFNDGGYATLTNDTFTNDLAYLGGAVSSGTAGFAAGTTIVTGDTFTGDSGTAIFYQYSNIGGHVTISDSLLASNPQGNCYAANAIPGTNLIYDGGGNVVDDTSCLGTLAPSATPSTVATDFQIWGPSATPPALAANGSTGPETVAIIPESAAAGAVSAASCLAADERGDARPGFTAPNCDAGAFELQGPALFVTVSGSQTYGSSTPTFTYGEAPANVSLTGTVTCSSVGGGTAIGSGLAAGSYTIDGASCSGLTAQGYTVDYLAAGEGFDVSPAPLVITASSATMTYGQTPPDIAASYYGFVNGEGMSALTSQPTCSTSASASSGVGTYSTSCTGAAASNYAVINLPGTLTIDPQVISVTVTGSQEYGSSTPSFTFTSTDDPVLTNSGLDCSAVFVDGGSTAISTQLAVGSYEIDASTCGGLSAASTNYSLEYAQTGDTFTVRPLAPAVVSDPSDLSLAAGATGTFSAAATGAPSPSVAWQVSTDGGTTFDGLANGTLEDGSVVSGADSVTLTVSNVAPSESGDQYRAVFANVAGDAMTSAATLQVAKPHLYVTVSGSQTYGSSDRIFTYAPAPIAATIDGTLTCSSVDDGTVIGVAVAAGSYTVDPQSCSGLSASGYQIDYLAAAHGFTVDRASLTVVAPSDIITYGASFPAAVPTYIGFVNGDGPSSLTPQPTCTSTATSPPVVGTYQTSCAGAQDHNYSITSVPGNESVISATLTITAASSSMTYGGTVPTITATYSGFVGSDSASSLAVLPKCSTTATSSAVVGYYTSGCTGAADANYAIDYEPGTVAVGPAPLTITASSATMSYGGTVPALTPDYSGFVNGDNAASLTAAPICSTTATSRSLVGTYPSHCSDAVDANYDISYVDGTVRVMPGVPSAPTNLLAVAGEGQAVLTWKAPASDGGSTVSNYLVFEGTHPGGEGSTPVVSFRPATATISGLTNGTTYYFTVKAVSAAGRSGPSNEASATPGAVPSAPTAVKANLDKKATPGVGAVDVSWSAPASHGSTIERYTILPQPSCLHCSGLVATTASSVVTGLTVGHSYQFAVEATNTVGTGPVSVLSSKIDVTTVPGAPTAVTAKLLPSGDVVISFSPSPIATGLSTTSYSVAPRPACPRCKGLTTVGTARVTTISGLSHGVSYTFTVQAVDADGAGPASSSTSPVSDALATGYYLAASDGEVFGLGMARSLGGITASTADPVVGVAATADGAGYLVVTRDGAVKAFGDAHAYGDLNGLGYTDIVSIVTTTDGAGYWLLGANGGVYPFGDAAYHGDLPGVGVHVTNVVGMVASPGGGGYQLIGNDGGVFAFGTTHFYGSLPGVHVHVHNIVGILPSATNTGYVLVGSDGGAFVFGTGTPFLGSLPGRHVHVNDIIGLALTADGQGYYMAGADGNVYSFGDAVLFPSPPTLKRNLPIVAIANI